jgi:polyribonucleotide nucleotidyltransferase
LIDRPIRPIIDEGWRFDTQILTWVLSFDHAHPPEPLAICAASAALAISDVWSYGFCIGFEARTTIT